MLDRNTFDRLVTGVVDDILNASSEEIIAEVKNSYGDEDKFIADVNEVFHEAVKQVDARRGERSKPRKPGRNTAGLRADSLKC
jgi:hypothetical protein